MPSLFQRLKFLKQYYYETVQEVKKCTWPTRDELWQHTVIVIVALLVLTAIIFGMDTVLQAVIGYVIRLGA